MHQRLRRPDAPRPRQLRTRAPHGDAAFTASIARPTAPTSPCWQPAVSGSASSASGSCPVRPLAVTTVRGCRFGSRAPLSSTGPSGAAAVRTGSPLVSDICCHLDGMPLAIELAAARSRLVRPRRPAGRARRSPSSARAGRGGRATGTPRCAPSSSGATGCWTRTRRPLFRRLGVFVGSFDLGAAVSGDGRGGSWPRTSDVIGRLADKSLLVQAQATATPAAGACWTRSVPTPREQLEASGELPEVRGRAI